MKHESRTTNHGPDHEEKKHEKKHKQESRSEVHVESHIEMETFSGADSQLEELEQDLKRVQAEFINYKRRSLEERGELLNLGKSEAVIMLLPLLDNISRALAHMPEDLTDNAWAAGVTQVAKQADAALGMLGVEKIPTVGEPFDPNFHEAVVMEDGTGDHEIVTEELQGGYRMGGRVLRHAMVKVGRK